VSNRIRQLRKDRGWSQQDLAVRAGLHVQTVSETEREYRGEQAESTWEAIAEALEVTVEELRGTPEPNGDGERAGKAAAT
jgi:transcriptional regulator with XRE-family HTH domain